MQITKLKSTDWQIFKTLRLESLKNDPKAFFSLYEEKILDSNSDWQQKFSEIYPYYYYAFEKDQPIGSAGYIFSSRTKTRHVVELVGVYVSPKFRGQGIAKQLIQAVISEIKTLPQIRKIRLNVIASQTSAIKLYVNLGFKEVGRLHEELNTAGVFYDEIIMEMMLK